jgi:formylglycine-generating enzyme required for sulfatase activity
MVIIPPGRFLMGSPAEAERAQDKDPQHPVTIARALAIGRFAVTFEEYDRFCAKTGRAKPGDSGWGRGQRPVINVSWDDATAYCAWLSQQTGHAYRLPSEAEWEYAARAGTTSAFWWGNQIDPSLANYDGNYTYANGPKGEYRERTLPVESFQPNPFGLYQVHGNVWEWCYSRLP